MNVDDDQNPEGEEIEPSFSRELFLEWRKPRFGSANPEGMTNPVWDWLVRSRLSAYQANERFQGPDAMSAGPGWCGQRFGQSTTQLEDGRTLWIAGEHEDHYDPDFYIYNDVIVRHPDGRIEILGYPAEIFPPTDFHSATLVGDRIVIIGNLGYPEQRKPGTTPISSLDLKTFMMTRVVTCGAAPGWIHSHKANLSEDGKSIVVERGLLDRGKPDTTLVENIDEWRLHLEDWRWERLTQRQWQRWLVKRKDGKMNHLWQFTQALWAKQFPELNKSAEVYKNLGIELPTLEQELGCEPDLDLFQRLYHPPIAYESIPSAEDEYNVRRIRIAGVVVRYVEDTGGLQMTVEGDLPQETINALTKDLSGKLSYLENTPCELVRL